MNRRNTTNNSNASRSGGRQPVVIVPNGPSKCIFCGTRLPNGGSSCTPCAREAVGR
ncbi:hypothetical protein [Amycolatopsis mediterranei]|uniref:hypothetical protein n=1 Tax=Amycolatopsis mediterranei TaxID=33910 RepID=UPI000B19D298|nr:hypothetical protein [Amycolatopsis mediterranei]UZF72910.1 hypothetical protein ISP_006307 [Amycolatopsis mediterranei]